MNPQDEITDNRPKNYSNWHRSPNLPNWCFQTDGDYFEQRIVDDMLHSVAYVETIEIPDGSQPEDYPVWNSKMALLNDIKNKMDIPCFVVWHYSSCKVFFVKKWDTGKILKMYETEYKNFIKSIDKR